MSLWPSQPEESPDDAVPLEEEEDPDIAEIEGEVNDQYWEEKKKQLIADSINQSFFQNGTNTSRKLKNYKDPNTNRSRKNSQDGPLEFGKSAKKSKSGNQIIFRIRSISFSICIIVLVKISSLYESFVQCKMSMSMSVQFSLLSS